MPFGTASLGYVSVPGVPTFLPSVGPLPVPYPGESVRSPGTRILSQGQKISRVTIQVNDRHISCVAPLHGILRRTRTQGGAFSRTPGDLGALGAKNNGVG